MKKYYICFFILAALLTAAVCTGAYFYLYRPQKEGPIPNGVMESESYAEENLAMNQEHMERVEVSGSKPGEKGDSQAQMAAGPADAARAEPGEVAPGDAGVSEEQSNPGAAGPEAFGPAGEFSNTMNPSEQGNGPAGEIPDGEERYCLVAEDGFLLVFAKDKDAVCLDTHMPLVEFPEKEQERLMEGIWFSTMMEIFNYLESYSS